MYKPVLLLVTILALPAAAARAPETGPNIDPQADATLRRMSDFLAHQHSFRFDSIAVDERVTTDGQKLQFVADSRVAVQRPNRLRADRLGPVADAIFRYDGKRFTVYGKRTGFWAEAPAPDNLDAAIDNARDRFGIEAPAADLLLSDSHGALMDGVTSGRYVGLEPIDGVMCHHLAFQSKDVDWQIWVEDGPRPLPRRYEITSKNQPGAPEFMASLSHWELNARLPASDFELRPPPGSKRIDFVPLGRAQSAR